MDDMTLIQLFAQMDAHTTRQDAILAGMDERRARQHRMTIWIAVDAAASTSKPCGDRHVARRRPWQPAHRCHAPDFGQHGQTHDSLDRSMQRLETQQTQLGEILGGMATIWATWPGCWRASMTHHDDRANPVAVSAGPQRPRLERAPMAHARIPIEERLDVPACQYCGGRARWLNAGIIDLGPWHWHCARCSPPPRGETASAGRTQQRTWTPNTQQHWRQAMANHLYYGDNLPILREHVPDKSVDLIYLDHPSTVKRPTTSCFAPALARGPHRLKPSAIPGTGRTKLRGRLTR